LSQHVTVHLSHATLSEALDAALKGTSLVAEMAADGETIVVRRKDVRATDEHRQPATGMVSGTVTDSASGKEISGATVAIKGTKLSTTTGKMGNFVLRDVPTGMQLLTVKLFGYKPAAQAVTVEEDRRVSVRLMLIPTATVLSGVVTTATGTQRKLTVGNDITSINVDSVMHVAPISSVTDLLETRVPGLTIQHSSGAPGDPSRLRLRGASSVIGNNDPIVIVDGVRVYASQSDARNDNLAPGVGTLANIYATPSPLDQLDPNNIQTIEVFKGPSASALYGSDAANGVIVITTKHGREGPTHWDLSLGQGVNWLPGRWPSNVFAFGRDEYGSANTEFCPWYDRICQVDSLVSFQALNDPRYSVFAHGSDQKGGLTISGGNRTLLYNLTGSASRDLGNLKLPVAAQQQYELAYGSIPGWMVRPDYLRTYGISGSLTTEPNPRLKVTLQSSLYHSDQQKSALQGAIHQLAGVYVDSVTLSAVPLLYNYTERATDQSLTSNFGLSAAWQFRPWLPVNATAGMQTMQRTDETYVPYGVNSYAITGSFGAGTDTNGSYGLGRGNSQTFTLNVGTNVPLFRQKLTVAAGGNYYSVATEDFSAYTDQLGPGVARPTTFENSGSVMCCSQSTTNASTFGWYIEPRLHLADKFFVSPGFRLDGGSGGAKGGISGLSAFPKIDLSYVAIDRSNRSPLWGVLTQLRPRLAFGFSGTQPGLADKLRLFNVGSYRLNPGGLGTINSGTSGDPNAGSFCPTVTLDGGSSYVPSVCMNALGNTQLRPERSSELELGGDADLWDGRFSATISWYNKTRHDAILVIPVAPSVSGRRIGTSIEKNIGVIRNTGTEMTLSATLLERRSVSWSVGMNISSNKNLVVRLNPGQLPIVRTGNSSTGGAETRVEAGYPLNGVWARPIVFFADANHDNLIEPDEIRLADSAVYLGAPNPNYQANFNTDLTLLNGKLSVHATFAYEDGLTQNNQAALTSGAFAQLPPGSSFATQAAVLAAQCVSFPVASGQCNSLGYGSQIGVIQTVNTFRFNNLSVNYELPRQVTSRFRVPRMTVALQGQNLGLHTNYAGKDPDVNAFSTVSVGDLTLDSGQIPLPRTWWLTVRLGN
jgi:TonB-linked SusC/RagA family outer membrane protein